MSAGSSDSQSRSTSARARASSALLSIKIKVASITRLPSRSAEMGIASLNPSDRLQSTDELLRGDLFQRRTFLHLDPLLEFVVIRLVVDGGLEHQFLRNGLL